MIVFSAIREGVLNETLIPNVPIILPQTGGAKRNYPTLSFEQELSGICLGVRG
jgi:hypothetical protein